MARIFTSDNVPLDYCRECYPEAREEALLSGLDADAEHPPYEDWPGEYECHDCGLLLGHRDNRYGTRLEREVARLDREVAR